MVEPRHEMLVPTTRGVNAARSDAPLRIQGVRLSIGRPLSWARAACEPATDETMATDETRLGPNLREEPGAERAPQECADRVGQPIKPGSVTARDERLMELVAQAVDAAEDRRDRDQRPWAPTCREEKRAHREETEKRIRDEMRNLVAAGRRRQDGLRR